MRPFQDMGVTISMLFSNSDLDSHDFGLDGNTLGPGGFA